LLHIRREVPAILGATTIRRFSQEPDMQALRYFIDTHDKRDGSFPETLSPE